MAANERDSGDSWDGHRSLEPLGIIDIGSNSVRLVVYEGAIRAAAPIFNEKVLCGLGRAVATTGRLGNESTARALASLERFHAITRTLGVKNVRALATAAVREAVDGPNFIERAERAAGVKIEVLSGDKEASLAASGIRMGFSDPSGIAGDLGGGSLELIDIDGEALNERATLPLGGLRLLDVSGDKLEKAYAIAGDELRKLSWLGKGKGRRFYAVGGTWRALAKLHMEARDYPLRVMQGYSIPTADAISFCEMVRRSKKLGQLPGMSEIARARREVLPYGALVLERTLEVVQPSEVVLSVFGIREGLLYELLPKHEKARDPLLSFCYDYARMRSRSVDHAVELCSWTDALFSNGDTEETSDERRLRHAACLLSDIGWRSHPDYRGEQSLNLVAHAGLAGIDHPGRIFLALSVYYRHAGGAPDAPDRFSERLRNAVTKRVVRRARITGAAIRVAHMLSIGMPGVIDECPLSLGNKKLTLTLPPAHAALDGERLRRRFAALAELVGREAEVRKP